MMMMMMDDDDDDELCNKINAFLVDLNVFDMLIM